MTSGNWILLPAKTPSALRISFGRDHHIKFRVLGGYSESESLMIKTYSRKDTIILFAFNELNKYNGFYELYLRSHEKPKLLCMLPKHIYTTPSQANIDINVHPVKSQSVNKWVIHMEAPDEFPNYFITADFKQFNKLTNLQPQKKLQLAEDTTHQLETT